MVEATTSSDTASSAGGSGPDRLLGELVRGVAGGVAKRVVVGLNWTLVEGPDGCGLAQTPVKDGRGCRPLGEAGGYAGRALEELAAMAGSRNQVEAALGLAAVNAYYNRFDKTGEVANGLDLFADLDGPVASIGRFPDLAKRVRDVRVIEFDPREGEYPVDLTEQVLADSAGVVITASTLVNGSLPRILAACPESARVGLIGPGTPLAGGLHRYGIDVLSGLLIEDVARAAQVIMEGGAVRAIKQATRYLTLRQHPN